MSNPEKPKKPKPKTRQQKWQDELDDTNCTYPGCMNEGVDPHPDDSTIPGRRCLLHPWDYF